MPPVTRREIVHLALPTMASAVLNNAFRIIDQGAAGSISTAAQAAIGACTFVLVAVWAVESLVAVGATPLLARATGAGDDATRRRVFGNGLGACLLIGVAAALGFGLGAEGVAAGLGLEGAVAADAARFLRTLGVWGVPTAALPLVDAAWVALGRPRRMLALQVGAAVVNAALNPLFIHGLDLGVAGAALATAIGRGGAAVVGVAWLWRELGPTRADLRFDPQLLRIARIGVPVAINTLVYAGAYALLLRTTVSPLGPVTNAALGIGFSALEGVSWPIYLGLSLAVAGIVGRRLGAGEREEARRAARLAFPMVTAAGLACGAVFAGLAEPLCAPFTDDPAVLAAAVGYARVLAWSQVFVAWEALAEGVLEGSGHTRPILWWSAPLNLLRVPLGWAFAFPLGMGAEGVWWAINLTTLLKAVGKGWTARAGGWEGAPRPGPHG